jgi:hypothetical protein
LGGSLGAGIAINEQEQVVGVSLLAENLDLMALLQQPQNFLSDAVRCPKRLGNLVVAKTLAKPTLLRVRRRCERLRLIR